MQDCIFCKIVAGEVPSTLEYQDEFVVAFRDIHPSAPVHVLVVPKQHITSLLEAQPDLIGNLTLVAAKIADKLGIGQGFQLVVNYGSMQEVKHLHYHLKGGMT